MLDFDELFRNIQRLVNCGFVEEAKSLYGSITHDIEQQERDNCMDRNYYLNEYMTRSIPSPDIPEPMFLRQLRYENITNFDYFKNVGDFLQKFQTTEDIFKYLENKDLSRYYEIEHYDEEDKNKSCYFESMIDE